MKLTRKIKIHCFIFGLCSLILSSPVKAQTADVKIIKIATLAPEGSTLANGLKQMQDEVKAKTNGKVDFRIFYGATAGDESDVVRKMRIGQLQGGALTGVGLGMIEPEIRVLEVPFIFENYQQADQAYGKLKGYFENKLAQKGFLLLGWAEVGFVKVFSKEPILKKDDLKGKKMWIYPGDQLAQALYECIGVVPVPAPLTDVLTSLQTGLIDAVYAPELGAIALQWSTKVKYMLDVNLVDATGGLVVTKAEFDTLTPDEQKTVKSVIAEVSQQLITKTRTDNQESQAALQSTGITINKITPEALAELRTVGQCAEQKIVGKLFPQSLLTQVKQSIGK